MASGTPNWQFTKRVNVPNLLPLTKLGHKAKRSPMFGQSNHKQNMKTFWLVSQTVILSCQNYDFEHAGATRRLGRRNPVYLPTS